MSRTAKITSITNLRSGDNMIGRGTEGMTVVIYSDTKRAETRTRSTC
jgi:hypothetical protein